MVTAARRHPAWTEGAADICVPAWRDIQLPQTPCLDLGRFPRLQHQDVGPATLIQMVGIYHGGTGKMGSVVLVGQTAKI